MKESKPHTASIHSLETISLERSERRKTLNFANTGALGGNPMTFEESEMTDSSQFRDTQQFRNPLEVQTSTHLPVTRSLSTSSADSDSTDQASANPSTIDLRRTSQHQHKPPCCKLPTHQRGALEFDSLYLFTGTNTFRRLMYFVVHSKPFEVIVIIVILANCVVLALEDPTKERSDDLFIVDMVFLALFTAEMLMKIVAFGFALHRHAYLRSTWNRLDFVIVLLSFVDVWVSFGKSTALRSLRVLRPLRSMNAIPELKALVVSLVKSVKGLLNVMLLCGFIFAIFGLLAVQLWAGNYRMRCRSDTTGTVLEDRYCRRFNSDTEQWGTFIGLECPSGYSCVSYANPNYGFTSFDNVGAALLVIFQCITLEGWAKVTYETMDHSGWYAAIYFVLLVIIGSYFLLNLALAVIAFEFNNQKDAVLEESQRRKTTVIRSIGRNSMFDPSVLKELPWTRARWIRQLIAWQNEEEDDDTEDENSTKRSSFWSTLFRIRCFLFRVVEGPIDTENKGDETTIFTKAIMLCIVVNSVFLAAEHHGQSSTQEGVTETANIVFTSIFAMEVVVKITALSFRGYFGNLANLFDCGVTVAAIGELIFLDGSGGLSVFRTVRLLRVFQLTRKFPGLKQVVDVSVVALKDTLYLNIFILLYLLIAALLGMQLFGGAFPPSEETGIRSNFDDFLFSFYTTFQVMTRDSWPDITWLAMHQTSPAAAIFFVICVICGDFIILNLFLAVLMSSWRKYTVESEDEDDLDIVEVRGDFHFLSAFGFTEERCEKCGAEIETVLKCPNRNPTRTTQSFHEQCCPLAKERVSRAKWVEQAIYSLENPSLEDSPEESDTKAAQRLLLEGEELGVVSNEMLAALTGSPDICIQNVLGYLKERQELLEWKLKEEQIGGALVGYTGAAKPPDCFTNGGESLFLFGPNNSFRIFLSDVVSHRYFDRVILLLIFVSSVMLAVENPRDPQQWTKDVSLAFTLIFTVEALMKIIAYGFVLHPTAYLRDEWNAVDFAIVVISLVSEVVETTSDLSFSYLKVVRAFRALRPLLAINRNRGLKLVVVSLLRAIPGIINVAVVGVLVYIVFAIVGVQFYKGAMFDCSDENINTRLNCTGAYVVNETATGVNGTINVTSVTLQREWENADFNFDNTYNAFLTLFQVATLDNWGETMFHVIDITDTDQGRRKNNRPYRGLFFVVFLIFGCFFFLNMFIGVIVHHFFKARDALDGVSPFVTGEQRKWVDAERMILNLKPTAKVSRAKNKVSAAIFLIAMDPRFEAFMSICILLNVVFIAVEHHDQPSSVTMMAFVSNLIFVVIFLVEAIVRIVAFGSDYFSSGWYRFDFFVVVISIVDVALDIANSEVLPINVGLLRVFRIFRILRILSLVKKARSLRVLLETLWFSLPSLVNIGGFLVLVFFIYSVIGVQVFGLVKRAENIDDHRNFEHFGNAFLFLFQVTTLDNWSATMIDMMNTDDCGSESNPEREDRCGTKFAPLFFLSFIIIASFVAVNMFISVIIENFETTVTLDKSRVKMADLRHFVDVWQNFDTTGTHAMETKRFPEFLASLQPPLGLSRRSSRIDLMLLCSSYDIPEHGGVIHFAEVLVPMARHLQRVSFDPRDIRDQEERWRLEFPELIDLPVLRYREKRVSVDQYFAATYIAAVQRGREARKLAKKLREQRAADVKKFLAKQVTVNTAW